ncbi:Saccharopine dehydrogenase [Xylariaceae sp. FL0255]|nr:Saccharopine dehydrogenase [Xylariaceae sp. FL0255]
MPRKEILVLGSGMVARPCVDYLLRRDDNYITVACRTLAAAQKLVSGAPQHLVRAISLDVSSPEAESVIAQHDVVVSLVPFVYHAGIARMAIRNATQVVTTSYVSPAIRELDGSAKDAGITVLNEVGVDPGVDHCYAMKVISEVHQKGGKIRESSDNPLRFKFSWSPRGALLSQNNAAIFLKDGKVTEIPKDQVMASAAPYHVVDGYSFLAYPNRNSVPFRELYHIPEAQTVIRGSLRYDGNPQLVKALIDLGWINADAKDWLLPGMTWAEIQTKLTAAASKSEADLVAKVKELCSFGDQNQDVEKKVIAGLRWIGLFSDEQQAPFKGTLLDTLSAHLEEVCKFGPDERDLVMLQHKFVVDWPNGNTDTITSTMELFGEPGGYSGMSKSVGITCGVATQLLLDGHPAVKKPGIVAPYSLDICEALREQIEPLGIQLVEKTL